MSTRSATTAANLREHQERSSMETRLLSVGRFSESVAADGIVENLLTRARRGESSALKLPAGRTNPLICDTPELISEYVGSMDFTSSAQFSVNTRLNKPPSSAFLRPVWRTNTMLLFKNDFCTPWIDRSRLFDTTGCYEFFDKKPCDVKACAEPAAAHVERDNFACYNNFEEKKGPEARDIGDSEDRRTDEQTVGFSINYANLKAERVEVFSWACVNYSRVGFPKLLSFVTNLRKMCVAVGMDISPEPTMLIHANSAAHYTDVENSLLTVREFFGQQNKDWAKVLVVILPDENYFDGKFEEDCKDLGVAYLPCLHHHAMVADKKYLRNAANDIMFKILERLACYSPEDDWDQETEEDDGSEEEDDGSEQESSETSQQLNVVTSFTKKRKRGDFKEGKLSMEEKHPVPVEVKASVKTWGCVCFAPLTRYKVYNFCEKIEEVCSSIGMDLLPAPGVFIKEKPTQSTDIENTLWLAYEDFMDQTKMYKIDLLIVILPQARDFHGKIEEVCMHMGVVCQYFWPMSAIKPCKEYLQKAAYEIKTKVVGRKMGQQTSFVHKAVPFVSEATIIFGADVIRASGCTSIASVVASMSWPEVSWYAPDVSDVSSSDMVIDDSVIRGLLATFHKKTKQKAKRIIFFRHGVTESQLDICIQEINRLKEACSSYGGSMPPITYVLVAIIHNRLPSPECSGRNEITNKRENVLSGGAVLEEGAMLEEDVSYPTKFDFVCDHASVKETSRLAHYRVILNENEFKSDELRSMCLNLCTPYYRWAYPEISMVPPAYFAHLRASKALEGV